MTSSAARRALHHPSGRITLHERRGRRLLRLPHGGNAEKRQPQLTPPLRTRSQIEAILARDFPPEMDAATREAYIAWGGPLDIRTGKDMPRWACQRPAPRIHPNLALAGALEETKEFYHATGDHQRVKAWARALSVVRAWPRAIRDAGELKGAHFIGNVRSWIQVFLVACLLAYMDACRGCVRSALETWGTEPRPTAFLAPGGCVHAPLPTYSTTYLPN